MFRDMRRKNQQLPDDECAGILKSAKRGVLAVHGDDGYPYAVPLDFIYEDGHIYFHCAKSGHKLDAVRLDDKVSFCVLGDGVKEPDDWWYHFKSVIVFGRVSEITDRDEKERRLRDLGMKYMPTAREVEDDMKRNGPRACVLDLTIEHMTGKRVKEN